MAVSVVKDRQSQKREKRNYNRDMYMYGIYRCDNLCKLYQVTVIPKFYHFFLFLQLISPIFMHILVTWKYMS